MPSIKSIEEVAERLAGKHVFLRVDYNVPTDNVGRITDASRIEKTLDTIRLLLDSNCRSIVIATHFKDPDYVFDMHNPEPTEDGVAVSEEFSTLQIAEKLQSLVPSFKIGFISSLYKVEEQRRQQPNTRIFLAENLRYHKFEKHAREMSRDESAHVEKMFRENFDLEVNDAFATLHREDYSIVSVPLRVYAGLLVVCEVEKLSPYAQDIDLLIIGGGKTKSKFEMLKKLAQKAKKTFVVGKLALSIVRHETSSGEKSEEIEQLLSEHRNIVLPHDFVGVKENLSLIYQTSQITEEIMSCVQLNDIGPQTSRMIKDAIAAARSVIVAGPPGKYEQKQYMQGTKEMFTNLAHSCKKGTDVVILGGNSVDAALKHADANSYTYLSTGGGAALAFLADGFSIPGLKKCSAQI